MGTDEEEQPEQQCLQGGNVIVRRRCPHLHVCFSVAKFEYELNMSVVLLTLRTITISNWEQFKYPNVFKINVVFISQHTNLTACIL